MYYMCIISHLYKMQFLSRWIHVRKVYSIVGCDIWRLCFRKSYIDEDIIDVEMYDP